MKEDDIKFYEEKVNTLKEHYKALVDVTRKYLYPWDFKPLGWYPETKFEVGIVKTIEWYLANQTWVEEVTSGDYQKYYEKMYGSR